MEDRYCPAGRPESIETVSVPGAVPEVGLMETHAAGVGTLADQDRPAAPVDMSTVRETTPALGFVSAPAAGGLTERAGTGVGVGVGVA